MHGKGKYSWVDGSFYDGDVNNNQISGYGRYEWSDGRCGYCYMLCNRGRCILNEGIKTFYDVLRNNVIINLRHCEVNTTCFFHYSFSYYAVRGYSGPKL